MLSHCESRVPASANVLLLVASLATGAAALADEHFCKLLPESKLHYRQVLAGDEVSLKLSIPAKYRRAEFAYAEIQIGDDPENLSLLRFTVAMARAGDTLSTQIPLPPGIIHC